MTRPPVHALVLLACAPAAAQQCTPRFPVPAFELSPDYYSAEASETIVQDFNADGLPDIAIARGYYERGLTFILGSSDGILGDPTHYPISRFVYHVAAIDSNGDGRPDVIVSSTDPTRLSLFLTRPDGALEGPTLIDSAGAVGAIASADFDRDGHPDLAVADPASHKMVVIPGLGNGLFGAPLVLSAGSTPIAVAIGDLNADGAADIACANADSNNVWLYLGLGDGTFEAPRKFLAGDRPVGVLIADLDRDGHPDLAATNNPGWGGGGIFWDMGFLMGRADGTFEPLRRMTIPQGAGPAQLADMDGDGLPDLLLPYRGDRDRSIQILKGHGDATFSLLRDVPLPTGAASFAAADLNADGTIDLAWAGNALLVLLNQGDTTFPEPSVMFPVSKRPRQIEPGDFDGDGRRDALILDDEAANVLVFPGDAHGGFGDPVVSPIVVNPTSLAIGDFNADGLQDFVVGSGRSSFHVTIFLGAPGGAFTKAGSASAGSGLGGVCTGDFDGDHSLDAASANGGASSVSVHYGNGDGTFGALVRLKAPANVTLPCAADFDGDGLDDLAVVSGARGEILFFRSLGGSAFAEPVVLWPGLSVSSLFAADVNDDSIPDLVGSMGYYYDYDPVSLFVYPARPDGTFGDPIISDPSALGHIRRLADMDGDGRPDAFMMRSSSSQYVTLRSGRADGSFAPARSFWTGIRVVDAMIDDLDADSRPDIMAIDRDNSRAAVLLNQRTCTSPCRTDCNQDGRLNINDFICMQAKWRARDPYGDYDGSGTYTINDFIAFQADFRKGCP